MKKRIFIKHLHKHNCILLKHGSKHDKYMNTVNGKRSMIPRHKELKRFLCVEICKQLEIPIVEGK